MKFKPLYFVFIPHVVAALFTAWISFLRMDWAGLLGSLLLVILMGYALWHVISRAENHRLGWGDLAMGFSGFVAALCLYQSPRTDFVVFILMAVVMGGLFIGTFINQRLIAKR